MKTFTYEALPGRVVFGAGSLARIGAELDTLSLAPALVLSTPGKRNLAERVADLLGPRTAGIFDGAVMHVPTEAAKAGAAAARAAGAACSIAIGGGSTIGLAKAIALETGLPAMAIPTTYSGSEMTPIWGLTAGGVKQTGRDPRVLPRLVIYDPDLLATLPPEIIGPSGVNALAHCCEALYAPDANPIVSLMAAEGIRALFRSLQTAVADPTNAEARAEALYGAYLGGAALGSVAMGLHHKLCHALGGRFNLPHAPLHTVILPYAMAYNLPGAKDAMTRAAAAMGLAAPEAVPAALLSLNHAIGAKTSLAALDMPEAGLAEAADLATRNTYPNPRPVTRDGVRELLEKAFYGRDPMA